MNFEPQRPGGERPAHLLVGDALHHAADLLEKEAKLFRAEMAENLRRMTGAVGIAIACAIFAVVAVWLVATTAVEWLAVELGSRTLAAAVCAAATGLIAIVLFLVARNRLSPSALSPDRTLRSLAADQDMLRRKVGS